jgi:NADH-quinone oxidoreductase subunit C
MDATDILQILREAVPDASLDEAPAVDMPTIVADRGHIVDVCRVLRDHPALQFALLADVTAADYLPAGMRYEVVYHLACLGQAYATGPAAPARRLRVKVPVPDTDARLPSVVSVFPGADWPERELFDLFGLVFEGHPDLRRILMPDDWEGFPLRKDYPVQIRKDTASWSPVQLSVEEFAENIRAQRDQAMQDARAPREGTGRNDGD